MTMSLHARFQQTLRHNLVLPDRELRQLADLLVEDALQWMNGHKAVPNIINDTTIRDTSGDGPNGPVAQQWDR